MPPFKYFITLLLVLLLLSACTTLEVGMERVPRSPLPAPPVKESRIETAVAPDPAALATAQARLTITPSPTPTPEPFDPNVYVGIPQEKTLYWDESSRVLFLLRRDIYGKYPADPNQGVAWYYFDDRIEDPFDFQKLHRPRVVLTSEGRIDFGKLDASRQFVYIWSRFDQTQSCTSEQVAQQPKRCSPGAASITTFFEHLIEFDLKTRTQRDIWTREIPSDIYPEFWGHTQIEQVVGSDSVGGRFVLLGLLNNDDEPSSLHGILVVNAETGQEKFLNLVGDVALDVRAHVVLYRNVLPFREKCDPSPGCELEGDYRIVYYPTGEVLTEQLP